MNEGWFLSCTTTAVQAYQEQLELGPHVEASQLVVIHTYVCVAEACHQLPPR